MELRIVPPVPFFVSVVEKLVLEIGVNLERAVNLTCYLPQVENEESMCVWWQEKGGQSLQA